MLYTKETYTAQKQMAKLVRTGESISVPGSKEEGLKQYRRLFRNNISNTMVQAFPITFEILNNDQWNSLVDDFFAKHDAQTPHVWKLPQEFYLFVSNNLYSEKFKLPFLNDLLLFEWLEIEVYTMADTNTEPYLKNGDALKDILEINPDYRLNRLEYPVHLYSGEESLKHKGDYYLLTYRLPGNFEVKYINMPLLHVLFFEKISIERMSGKEIIEQLLNDNPGTEKGELTNNYMAFIKTMLNENVFLGYSQIYHN